MSRPFFFDVEVLENRQMLAAHYAVHPQSGLLKASEPGTLTAGADGRMQFTAGGGKIQALSVDPAQREKLLAALVEMTSAKPISPQQRFRPPSNTATPAPPPKK